MSYIDDKEEFDRNPTPRNAGHLVASAMKESGEMRMTDDELLSIIFAIRDFLYRKTHPMAS